MLESLVVYTHVRFLVDQLLVSNNQRIGDVVTFQ